VLRLVDDRAVLLAAPQPTSSVTPGLAVDSAQRVGEAVITTRATQIEAGKKSGADFNIYVKGRDALIVFEAAADSRGR
jgi:hypothetical protein